MIFSITISAKQGNRKLKKRKEFSSHRTIGHHMTDVLDNRFDIHQH